MKKLNNKIVTSFLIIALLISPLFLVACPKQFSDTASNQIAQQTDDPVAIAKAAYLDALNTYNGVAMKYAKYAVYMSTNYPDIHSEILYYLSEMDNLLIMWEGFSQLGVIPTDAPQQLGEWLELISMVLMELDKGSI